MDLQTPTVRALSIPEAMFALRVDRSRIYRMIADGTLESYKIGRRRFVSVRALEKCIERLEHATNSRS